MNLWKGSSLSLKKLSLLKELALFTELSGGIVIRTKRRSSTHELFYYRDPEGDP